jgi:hypothetical protein
MEDIGCRFEREMAVMFHAEAVKKTKQVGASHDETIDPDGSCALNWIFVPSNLL